MDAMDEILSVMCDNEDIEEAKNLTEATYMIYGQNY